MGSLLAPTNAAKRLAKKPRRDWKRSSGNETGGEDMRLRTKLKIIRLREQYLDAWDNLRSWTHKHDFWQVDNQPRWKIVAFLSLLWASDIIYYGIGPFRTLQKQRHNQAKFTRVKGISRTTTRPLRPYSKNLRVKWKDREPPTTITTQQINQQTRQLMEEIRKAIKG